MKKSTSIILLAVVIILFIAPLVMYNGYGEDEGYFGGADDKAGEAIVMMKKQVMNHGSHLYGNHQAVKLKVYFSHFKQLSGH